MCRHSRGHKMIGWVVDTISVLTSDLVLASHVAHAACLLSFSSLIPSLPVFIFPLFRFNLVLYECIHGAFHGLFCFAFFFSGFLLPLLIGGAKRVWVYVCVCVCACMCVHSACVCAHVRMCHNNKSKPHPKVRNQFSMFTRKGFSLKCLNAYGAISWTS